jgi:hypothetical protein
MTKGTHFFALFSVILRSIFIFSLGHAKANLFDFKEPFRAHTKEKRKFISQNKEVNLPAATSPESLSYKSLYNLTISLPLSRD